MAFDIKAAAAAHFNRTTKFDNSEADAAQKNFDRVVERIGKQMAFAGKQRAAKEALWNSFTMPIVADIRNKAIAENQQLAQEFLATIPERDTNATKNERRAPRSSQAQRGENG